MVTAIFARYRFVILRLLVLDEAINDVVLKRIHNQREEQHDKEDLYGLISFSPSQRPVADLDDPWTDLKYAVDAELHAQKTEKVDQTLLKPPFGLWRTTIVAGLDRFLGITEGRERKAMGKKAQENDEDGYADCGLR